MAILYKSGETKKFLERRAKRLIPAYFATVILTLFASLFVVLPSELGQVVTQSIYSLFFANNIGFWMQNSYFSKSDFNPLLHLWSLGVEIQFYLIVPLLVWLFRKSKFLLPATIVGSFAACIFIVGISPKTSFFMMPLRMWEFLIGFAAACYLTNGGSIKYKNLNYIGLTGLIALIAIPFMNVDGQSLSRMLGHPSFYALGVCIATLLIIAFGLPEMVTKSFIGKIFARIGDYSYSIYLVHFPIIVLYLYQPFSGTKLYPESYFDKGVLFLLIVAASILMHKFIENRRINGIGKLYLISVVFLFTLAGAAKVVPNIIYTQGEQNIFNGLKDRASYRCGKIIRIQDPSAISCKLNNENFEKSVMLLGNSHADAIKTVFSSVMNDKKYNTYFIVSNTPMMGSTLPPKSIIKEALSRKVSEIFVHYKSGSLELEKLSELVESARQKNIRVTLILPVPDYENDPYYEQSIPKALYKGKESKLKYSDYLLTNNILINKAIDLKFNFSNFDYLDIAPIFCDPKCSIGTIDKKPYYFDDNHLTLTGAQLLKPLFERKIIR